MYSYEEKIKAVKLLIKYDKYAQNIRIPNIPNGVVQTIFKLVT